MAKCTFPIRFTTQEAIPDEVWTAAREAAAAGVPLEAIARRAGIYVSWMEDKAKEEGWMTEARRKALLAQYEIQQPEKVQEAIADIQLATAALSQDRALLYRAEVATQVEKKVRAGVRTIQAPKSWKDLDTADKIARRALGLDEERPQSLVQLNLLHGSAAVEDA